MVWVAWEVSVQVINVNISHLVFVRRCASDLGQTVAGPLLIENKCYPVLQSNCVSTAVHSLCNWGPDVCKHTKMIITFTHFYVAPVTLTRKCYISLTNKVSIHFITWLFFSPPQPAADATALRETTPGVSQSNNLNAGNIRHFNFKRLSLFCRGTPEVLFHRLVMCETDWVFLSSCSDSRQSQERWEKCRGRNVPLYYFMNYELHSSKSVKMCCVA